MNKRVKLYAVACVVIVILGLFILSFPQERLIYNEEYTDLEFYPTYYYANFTVASSDTNAELSFDIEIDFGGNYTDCTTLWILYNKTVGQFEDAFNLTEARNAMSSEDWDVDDFDGFWAGWFIDNTFFPFWEPVTSGEYVIVFWIEPDGPTTGWSTTLTISLRTSILPRL